MKTYKDLKEEIERENFPSTKSFAKSKDRYKDLVLNITEATSFLDELRNLKFSVRIMCIFKGLTHFPECQQCGSPVKGLDKIKLDNPEKKEQYNTYIFRDFCSRKCTVASGRFSDRAKQTNLERYGVENAAQSDVAKERTKKTNNERYGVDWHTQSENFKAKASETWKQNYGDDIVNPSQTQVIKDKKRESSLEKYGTETVLQSDIVKDKIKKTNLERYGYENVSQSEHTKTKIKKTMVDRYGVENALQSKIIQNRVNTTNIEKYGTPWVCGSDYMTEKSKITNIEKYGVPYITQTSDFLEKTKETSLRKYGTEHPSQSDKVKAACVANSLEKYGTEHPMKNHEYYHDFITYRQYKKKEYSFPSGNIVLVQGYEDRAIDKLLKEFEEQDIIIGEGVPSFEYTLEGKTKTYYPDIYVESTNTVIEVKSTYTVRCDKEMNIEKWKSVIMNGYNFKLMVI